jgi:hypothetical protein
MFEPVDQAGDPIAPENLPLVIAMTHSHPAHKAFWIRGLDQKLRQIELTAFPLLGQSGRISGAVSIFWEVP